MCIAYNLAAMLCDHAGKPWALAAFLEFQGALFLLLLAGEVLLLAAAYGPGGFVDEPWRGFDALILVGAGASQLLYPELRNAFQVPSKHTYPKYRGFGGAE